MKRLLVIYYDCHTLIRFIDVSLGHVLYTDICVKHRY